MKKVEIVSGDDPEYKQQVNDLDLSALRNHGSDFVTSGDVFQDLHTMHEKFGFHDHPMTLDRLRQRLDFIQEELNETRDAMNIGDAEGVIDGLIDIGVVQIGTIDLLNVRFWRAWNAVYVANMAKKFGLNPNRPDSQGLDLYKPEGWTPPSHYRNVGVLPSILIQPPPPRRSMTILELLRDSQIAIPLTNSIDTINGIPRPLNLQVESMFALINQVRGTEETETSDFKGHLTDKLTKFIHDTSFAAAFLTNYESGKLASENQITSADVINECIEIQKRKTADYQAEESDVTQADYYPNGISDIIYMLHLKMTRVRSLIEKLSHGGKPVNESIADTLRDSINYASFGLSWIEGKLEGQNPENGIFNQFR